MVRDDVNSPQKDPLRRTPLARIIAGAPGGLDSDRVVKWAGDLAAVIDERMDRGARHGNVDPDHVVIDEHDRAQLEAGHADRDLLLGDAVEAPGDDVRALAATLYEALAGKPPDVDPVPIAGVEVCVNMGLLAALGSPRSGGPRRASELVSILRGEEIPAPSPVHRPAAASSRSAAPALSVMAGAVTVAAALAAVWIWLESRPARPPVAAVVEQSPLAREGNRRPRPRPRTGIAGELAEVERDIEVAAAARARRHWETVGARLPDILFDELREEANRIAESGVFAGQLLEEGRTAEARALFEQATAAMTRLIDEHGRASQAAAVSLGQWRAATTGEPDEWSTDEIVQLDCADAEALAGIAEQEQLAGRYGEAVRTLDDAAELRRAALSRHDGRVDGMLEEYADARDAGRFEDAIAVIDELEPFRDPVELRAMRVETYLEWARARNRRSSRGEARRAVNALLELEPDHVAGLSLRRSIAVHWQARAGDLLVNSLSQTLVLIEPGTFEMGSPRTELFHQRSEQQHAVHLTRRFWIGRIEVTRGQFAAFVAATGYVTDAENAGWSLGLGETGQWWRVDAISWRDPGFPQSDNEPVVCVSWNDAVAFCEWLSEVEGRPYRLPTEAQWEFGCRAGSVGAYTWGNDPYRDSARTNGADESWMARFPDTTGFAWQDGHVFTAPVASFPANGWGIFDMHGNAKEWCNDVYAPYDPSMATDPVGPPPAPGDHPPRVLRGGSFASAPAACRAAHRDASAPDSSFVTVGFRVVLQE